MSEMTLNQLREMADLMLQQEAAVERCAAELETAKAALMKMQREDMPAMMQEVGLPLFGLPDGRNVELAEGVEASIPKESQAEAFEWLERNGHGGLIKTRLTVALARGELALARKAGALLRRELELESDIDEGVHAATLKGWAKERLEAGEAIPCPPFRISAYTFAKISKGKRRP